MKREEGSSEGLAESKRERSKEAETQNWRRERERKWEKEETCGPSNGNKLGPIHEFSPDLNLDWIKKQVKG
jgi:hypothetical protein